MDKSFVSAVAGIVLFFGAVLLVGTLISGGASIWGVVLGAVAVGFGAGILFSQKIFR